MGADWLGAARRAADVTAAMLDARPATADRVQETGERGEGGDRTLEIDAAAEQAVFDELDGLHRDGARFTVVSEERGEVDYGGDGLRVVVDPLDGSRNAKRGFPHLALSIGVADGPTMGDMCFGFVRDFGSGEEWVAWRGRGAELNGQPLDPTLGERRGSDGRLELVGLESADPRYVRERADALAETAGRLRALGAIAVTLCQVAAARLDGMLTLRGCRAVDCAAGQLIVREAGGYVAFTGFADPLGAPLDLAPHSPLVAARSAQALAELARVPRLPSWDG